MSDSTPPSGGSEPTPPSYGGNYGGSYGYGAPPPSGGPYYGGGSPGGQPPPNHLVWAILSTLFCCLPLGIVSIVFAAQVNSKWNGGDANGAHEASRKAKTWALWSTIVGAVVLVIYVFLVVAGALTLDGAPADAAGS